jgi:sulfate transport system permease protein
MTTPSLTGTQLAPAVVAADASRRARRFRARRVLPGFRLTLGFTVFYVSLAILIPLAGVFLKTATMGFDEFWNAVATPRAFAAYRLTFGASLIAASINAVFGLLIAWVLVRYPSPLTRVFDAMVDLPFAMPTAVAGIALTAVYSANGWIGQYLEPLGIKVAFTRLGVLVALTFIGLPFVVRSVQPVLQDLESDVEEAAASLGATRAQTFRRIILPSVLPALITGFTLAFARALGEYGSVIFISGNMPLRTEITTLLIVTKLEQYDYNGATAIATVMLLVSFILLLIINLAQAWARRRTEAVS